MAATKAHARQALRAFVAPHHPDALELDDQTLRRRALRLAHPDHGGDPDVFRRIQTQAQRLSQTRRR